VPFRSLLKSIAVHGDARAAVRQPPRCRTSSVRLLRARRLGAGLAFAAARGFATARRLAAARGLAVARPPFAAAIARIVVAPRSAVAALRLARLLLFLRPGHDGRLRDSLV